MASKGHGMWFKNLTLLQHQKHVNIIEFSNLLSALVSQDALTINGFFEEFIINKSWQSFSKILNILQHMKLID